MAAPAARNGATWCHCRGGALGHGRSGVGEHWEVVAVPGARTQCRGLCALGRRRSPFGSVSQPKLLLPAGAAKDEAILRGLGCGGVHHRVATGNRESFRRLPQTHRDAERRVRSIRRDYGAIVLDLPLRLRLYLWRLFVLCAG